MQYVYFSQMELLIYSYFCIHNIHIITMAYLFTSRLNVASFLYSQAMVQIKSGDITDKNTM